MVPESATRNATSTSHTFGAGLRMAQPPTGGVPQRRAPRSDERVVELVHQDIYPTLPAGDRSVCV